MCGRRDYLTKVMVVNESQRAKDELYLDEWLVKKKNLHRVPFVRIRKLTVWHIAA